MSSLAYVEAADAGLKTEGRLEVVDEIISNTFSPQVVLISPRIISKSFLKSLNSTSSYL